MTTGHCWCCCLKWEGKYRSSRCLGCTHAHGEGACKSQAGMHVRQGAGELGAGVLCIGAACHCWAGRGGVCTAARGRALHTPTRIPNAVVGPAGRADERCFHGSLPRRRYPSAHLWAVYDAPHDAVGEVVEEDHLQARWGAADVTTQQGSSAGASGGGGGVRAGLLGPSEPGHSYSWSPHPSPPPECLRTDQSTQPAPTPSTPV